MADNSIAHLLAKTITRRVTGDPDPSPFTVGRTLGVLTERLRNSIPADEPGPTS